MLALHDRLAEVRARREEGEKGFTLIELLVVVIIIGILAAIAIPIFLGQQNQARNSAVEASITTAKTQVIAASVELGKFPDASTTPTLQSILDAAESEGVTLTSNGTGEVFCIQGDHAGTAETYAADATGGVIEGTCVAGVATPATTGGTT